MTGPTLNIPLKLGEGSGRALAKIPFDLMGALGVHPGDCVSVTAAKTSHARVMPAQRGGQHMEVSADLFANLNLCEGQEVAVAAAALRPAQTVLLQLDVPGDASAQDLAEALDDLPLTVGDRLSLTLRLGRQVQAEVLSVEPERVGIFTEKTALTLAAEPQAAQTYAGIGGMQAEIARVHDMVVTPLLRPDLFARLGVPAPRGVLFTGPPGCGKTLLARSIAARTSAAFFQINGPEIVSKHYGESEAALRAVFEAAEKAAPAIVFIDEIDAIAPSRAQLSGEKQVERRVVAQLLTLMDGLSARGQVIVMAATNLPDAIDPALRRPGRFDREVGFTPPDAAQRAAILGVHLAAAPLAGDVVLAEIAAATHGYVGADLAAVAREASLAALDRTMAAAAHEQDVRAEDLHITQSDLLKGVALTGPSALRSLAVTLPEVTFDDIGGLKPVKTTLREAVLWPLAHREACRSLGLTPAAGVLLSGPPGTGKTLIAQAVAAESGMNFIPVRPSVILSQFLGDAERAIADVFAKARHAAPCLIFLDELDTLAPRRGSSGAAQDRLVAQLLTEMDGLAQNADVVVLAATNRAAAIDPALTRPGRFDLVVPIPLPDATARHAILQVHCRKRPLAPGTDLIRIAAACDGASGADLAGVVVTADRHALRRTLAAPDAPLEIGMADFDAACRDRLVWAEARESDFITRSIEDA